MQKKKNMNHKNKNNIPPFLWLLYLRAGCGCGGGWLTGEDKIKHCKAVETILSWLCESVDIKWQHYTCVVKASAILQPTIVLQNVSQPVKTGFRCRVVDPPAGFVPLAAWTQNSKFTTVPDSRLWGWRWMTDSRGRVMTRQDIHPDEHCKMWRQFCSSQLPFGFVESSETSSMHPKAFTT